MKKLIIILITLGIGNAMAQPINTSTAQWLSEQDTYSPFGSPRMSSGLMSSIIQEEGGYTNDPNDLGGPTKYGIAYNYNKNELKKYGINKAQDIINLTEDQANEIYTNKYYIPSKASNLPYTAKLAYMNTYINSPVKSVRALQETIGATVDGKFGKDTTTALNNYLLNNSKEDLAKAIRKNYVKELFNSPTWSSHGNGWVNRFLKLKQTNPFGAKGKNKVNLNTLKSAQDVIDAIKNTTGIDLN